MVYCLNCNETLLISPSDISKLFIVCPKCNHKMSVKYEKTGNTGYTYYTHDLKLYNYISKS
ncbi:MAG: hypothetical protein PHD05_00385 [Sphaerochaetaceae bacterium]|nr:hypothetical protein [Sphaerochaetaceae bacterium]